MSISHSIMSEEQVEEFLEAPRFGILGTNRRDGPPQMTAVWYLYRDGNIYVSMMEKSAKHRNLSRDPRATLVVSGDSADARAVVLCGPVELYAEGSEPWVADISWQLTRRYYDSDEEAKEFIESESDAGASVLALLRPEKIIAQDYN